MADTDRFFVDYAKAVQKMHALGNDGRNWITQAKIHADHCHHGDVEFLYWHRHYIRFFEQICAELSGNPAFALPYLNWSKNSGRLPAPFFDMPELNVEHWNDPGKYNGAMWGPVDTVGRRGLDKTHGLLDDPARAGAFTLETINSIKQLPTIDLFESALEGTPHNTGHVVAGATKTGKRGHIGDGLSPLDPIFWLHHCMVDRIWAEWQKSGHATPDPSADYSGDFFEADGTPARDVSSTKAMDIATLGYTYDIFQGTLPSLANVEVLSSSLTSQQIEGIKKLLKPRDPRTLGTVANSKTSVANIQTRIDVPVPALTGHAAELSTMAAAGLTLGNQRVLAKLSDVERPAGADLVVNVFVDCPYLAPTTPFSDPHYAGTFSFFGAPSMAGMKAPTYLIDITRPVREAAHGKSQIGIQLMPVSSAADGTSESQFKIGKVEVLIV